MCFCVFVIFSGSKIDNCESIFLFKPILAVFSLFIKTLYVISFVRLVAALIEANHDEKGIVWPHSISPFDIGIINLSTENTICSEISCKIYENLKSLGKDVLYDDSNERAGVKMANMDLLELRNLVDVANIITTSALERKESRGRHFNKDYPHMDKRFNQATKLLNNDEDFIMRLVTKV